VPPSVYVCAVILVKRVLQAGLRLTWKNVHRLFLAAYSVACKMLLDTPYANSYVAKVGGVTVDELYMSELQLIGLVRVRSASLLESDTPHVVV
jgi:hypothetical protein